jgi:hypothetical protein
MVPVVPIDPKQREEMAGNIYESIDTMTRDVDRTKKSIARGSLSEILHIAPSASTIVTGLEEEIRYFDSAVDRAISMKKNPALIAPTVERPDPLDVLDDLFGGIRGRRPVGERSLIRLHGNIWHYAGNVAKEVTGMLDRRDRRSLGYFERYTIPFPGRFHAEQVFWPPGKRQTLTSAVETVMDGGTRIGSSPTPPVDAFAKREVIVKDKMMSTDLTDVKAMRKYAMEGGVTTVYPGREDLGNLLVDAFPVEAGKSGCDVKSSTGTFVVGVPEIGKWERVQLVSLDPAKAARAFDRLSKMPMDDVNQRVAVACAWHALKKVPKKSEHAGQVKKSIDGAPRVVKAIIDHVTTMMAKDVAWTTAGLADILKLPG